MKKLFLVLFFTLLLNTAFASSVQAAEGDLAWQDDYPEISRMDQAWANPSNKPINIIQDTLYLGQWVNVTTGGAKIFKRTHGALGWEAPLTIPTGGNPVYVQLLSAADDSGVYIANPTHIAQNLGNGRLALSKLDTNGVFIKNINQISQNFTTVSYIVVDDTGVYVSGGSGAGWVVEKWSKDLNTSLWKYYSKQSGGDSCDHHGPRSIVRDDSYLYLGGCIRVGNNGLTVSRLEKVNKTNKHQEWVKIDGSAPSIGVMAIDSGNLYIGAGEAYWGGWTFPNSYPSVLQKRTLNNDPVIWTQPFNSERIIALAVDGNGIYRGFIDANSKMMKVDKRKFSDGTLLSPKVITSGITAYEVSSNPLPGFVLSYKDNMSIDSTGIYLAGALGTQCGGSFWACYRVGGRVEKYGHLGLPANTLKICLNSCNSGSNDFNGKTVTLPSGDPNPYRYAVCYNTASDCSLASGDITALGTTSFSASDTPADAVTPTATKGEFTANTVVATQSEDVAITTASGNASMRFTTIYTAAACSDCDDEKAQHCPNETWTNGCGDSCGPNVGTRYCDMNWKEVAPGR
jgi:hypothetical protein